MIDIPQTIGQDRIKDYLGRCIDSGRIPHALIISGEKNSGKLELAKRFAMEVMETSNADNPDIKIIDLNPKGIKYVKTIREQLIDNILINPYGSDYKFYIIAGAGKMPTVAQNALLKSLEEPPEYASVIMLTDNVDKLLPTIRSRSIKLFLKPVEVRDITEYLIKQGIEESKAKICAELSMGNMSKAIALSKDREYLEFAETVGGVVANIAVGKAPAFFSDEIKSFSEEMYKFLQLMEILLRDVLVYKLSNNIEDIIVSIWAKNIILIANKCTFDQLGSIRERILKTYEALNANAAKDVLMDLLLIEIGGNY